MGLAKDCKIWMEQMLLHSFQLIVPEIADYEVRRELLRGNRIK